MTYYIATFILAELMALGMILHVLRYTGFEKVQKLWFILTFGTIMICAAAEFAVHNGYYDPKFATLLTVVTVIQFSLAPMLGILFSGALGRHRQRRVLIVFFALNLATEVICAPFQWIFGFDANGYFRGPAFIAYEIFFFLSLLYLIVNMILIGRTFRHRDVTTILMVLIVVVAGILPMAIAKVNITYVALTIGACLCYIYYNDLVQQDIQSEFRENTKRMNAMQEHIISGLANLIENRDTDTGGHIGRTSLFVKTLAEDARNDGVYADRIDDEFIELIHTLAPLHDVGKIVVSDNILKKPGRLTPEEFEEMKKHASFGGKVVRDVLDGITEEEDIAFASDIVSCHHEWWNGSGYPNGLKGEEIPLSARIMAIADVYDALISERCYKRPMPVAEALEIIRSESGTHFDPQLVEVFLRHKDDFDLTRMHVSYEGQKSVFII